MTIGGKQYNEADLLQMQRDAEARVRDMQKRARETVWDTNTSQPRQHGWSQNPGMRRRPPRAAPRPPDPPDTGQEEPAVSPGQPEPAPDEHTDKTKNTVIGDVMSALGLDEDYLLIIGLILILINQRADTTLILALAYLLI